MPTLDHESAIKEYWETVKHKYPNISFSRFRDICRAPFEFVKFCISKRKDLPSIRIKYLGEFKVYPSTVRNQIKKNYAMYKKGYFTYTEYVTKENELKQTLAKLEQDAKENQDAKEETTD